MLCKCTTCSGDYSRGFKLSYGGYTTALIAPDSNAATIDSALEVKNDVFMYAAIRCLI